MIVINFTAQRAYDRHTYRLIVKSVERTLVIERRDTDRTGAVRWVDETDPDFYEAEEILRRALVKVFAETSAQSVERCLASPQRFYPGAVERHGEDLTIDLGLLR